MRLSLERSVGTAAKATENVLRVAAMFGLGVDQQREMVIVPPTAVELRGGQVVFVTGPSGSGKSTVLRLIEEGLRGRGGVRVIDFDRTPALPDEPLVDAMSAVMGGAALEEVLRVLSLSGLNDAFVMLRRPSELSDGQRYRARLA